MERISSMNQDLSKFYLVGGCVRDELLGVPSKDFDFVVLVDSFELMEAEIVKNGGEIFLRKPEFQVIRARLPNYGAADFALPRTDGIYLDGRRPDSTKIAATLYADSCRRDITINAMYKNLATGEIIDYHNGKKHVEEKYITCVGNAKDRFTEDFLRPLRCFRISITKNMTLDRDILDFLKSEFFIDNINKVSKERVREEMHKAFKHSSLKTLILLEKLPQLRNFLFGSDIFWLNFGILPE